jgi:hypothetical protein
MTVRGAVCVRSVPLTTSLPRECDAGPGFHLLHRDPSTQPNPTPPPPHTTSNSKQFAKDPRRLKSLFATKEVTMVNRTRVGRGKNIYKKDREHIKRDRFCTSLCLCVSSLYLSFPLCYVRRTSTFLSLYLSVQNFPLLFCIFYDPWFAQLD